MNGLTKYLTSQKKETTNQRASEPTNWLAEWTNDLSSQLPNQPNELINELTNELTLRLMLKYHKHGKNTSKARIDITKKTLPPKGCEPRPFVEMRSLSLQISSAKEERRIFETKMSPKIFLKTASWYFCDFGMIFEESCFWWVFDNGPLFRCKRSCKAIIRCWDLARSIDLD